MPSWITQDMPSLERFKNKNTADCATQIESMCPQLYQYRSRQHHLTEHTNFNTDANATAKPQKYFLFKTYRTIGITSVPEREGLPKFTQKRSKFSHCLNLKKICEDNLFHPIRMHRSKTPILNRHNNYSHSPVLQAAKKDARVNRMCQNKLVNSRFLFSKIMRNKVSNHSQINDSGSCKNTNDDLEVVCKKTLRYFRGLG